MFAQTLTKLSLPRWFQLMGFNPIHAQGVYWPDGERRRLVCETPWLQRADQAADRVGREEVAQAIAQAEADIERELGYRVLPSWETDEWRDAYRPNRPELLNRTGTDIRGFAQVVDARWGYIISGGIRAKALIQAGVAAAYTDTDGDLYKETGTVTVNVTSAVAACEVKVYMPVGAGGPADSMPRQAADDRYEIRPIDVTIAAGVATIKFRRELAVEPHLQDDIVPPADDSHLRGVDGQDDSNFLATVDVYRVYNDPQTQATFLWEPFGTGFCESCNGSGCELCSYATQTGCLMIRGDPRLGMVSYKPGSWDATDAVFEAEEWTACRAPDIVRLYYYAGWQDKSQTCPRLQMDPEWERVVAYYAASLLDRPVCECNNVHAWIEHWRKDFAISGADEQSAQVPMSALDNPFGTTRGALFAWKRVLREGKAVGRAVMV